MAGKPARGGRAIGQLGARRGRSGLVAGSSAGDRSAASGRGCARHHRLRRRRRRRLRRPESDGRAHVDFPASSPHTLAVGGTMLYGDTDVVWWQSPGERTGSAGGSTGGGVSVVFPRPSWQDVQITSINPGSIDGRVVPDVAALAGPPFYDLIFMGQDQPNGGTSAATPLWAALIALMAARPRAAVEAAVPGAAALRRQRPATRPWGRPAAPTSPAAITHPRRSARATAPAPGSMPSAAGACLTARPCWPRCANARTACGARGQGRGSRSRAAGPTRHRSGPARGPRQSGADPPRGS